MNQKNKIFKISLNNVCLFFGQNKVLNNINLTFESGKISALSGNNGSGKTTLLLILAGLLKPTMGNITINDNKKIHNDFIRGQIGFLSHEPLLYPGLTPLENLSFFSILEGTSSKEKIFSIAKKLNLENGLLNTPCQKLSRGQLQKVSFAKILIQEPSILLLDEPTSFLDSQTATLVKTLIDNFKKQGAIILITSHDTNFLESLSTSILELKQGKITHLKNKEQKIISSEYQV
jgi:heme ABC exporter ATP-binding subunit CcmA